MNKIELLRQMAAANPENAQTWFLLGLEYAEQGNIAEALQAYTNSLRTCNEDLKGDILSELGKLSSGVSNQNKSDEPPQEDGQSNEEPTVPIEYHRKLTAQLVDTNESTDETEEKFGLRVLRGGMADSPVDSTPNRVTFADVGGLTDVKQSIEMKIIKPFTTPGLFSKFKKKVGGGILLYGPPGCGKTFIAKATAGECRATFINVHISDILGKYVGESEENLHSIFTSARAQRPCVLFFDEIDTLGYSRAKSTSQPLRGVIDQLLVEMEGMNTDTDRILIIGATNTPWDVDAAFKRPGRFDKAIFVAPPDLPARTRIFQLKLQDRPVADIDFALLASQTDLYSGADIENVVELATERVIAEILSTGVERPIHMNDLRTAIADTQPSTINWLKTVKNYIKYANQDGQYNEVESYLQNYRRL